MAPLPRLPTYDDAIGENARDLTDNDYNDYGRFAREREREREREQRGSLDSETGTRPRLFSNQRERSRPPSLSLFAFIPRPTRGT